MDLSGILAAANPSSQTNVKSTSQFGQDFDQFLNLLTTQLKNQDPLQPMDSAEFTNQLVQFSSVEQQIRGNDYLQKMLSLQSLSLTGVGLSYVGMNVQIPGSAFTFDGTDPAQVSYSMPAGAVAGTLSIQDTAGGTIFSEPANLAAGHHNFIWNGKDNNGNTVAAGTYKLVMSGQDGQQQPLDIPGYVSGAVTGVQTADDGNVMLMIGDKLVPVTDVRQASLPSFLVSN